MRQRTGQLIILIFASLISQQALLAQKQVKPVPPLSVERGKLQYHADERGNRIPDFSYCGYKASEAPIPMVPVKIFVPHRSGDATAHIQAAIDLVSSMPADAQGFRGAVLLAPGQFNVWGQLLIRTSGVVLRGSGTGPKGTILVGAGSDRETLIRIVGKKDLQRGTETKVADAYVPVNANTLTLSDVNGLSVGDNIFVRRPSTANWIKTLGTDHFGGGITALGWKPGDHDIHFDRKITAINGNSITIDVPLTTAFDSGYGGGYVSRYTWDGRLGNVGIEHLSMHSSYEIDNSKDEAHRWMAVTIENAADVWVRQATFRHFAGSAVMIFSSAKRVTVEDCVSEAPISEIAGERRNSYYTAGQQTLFQRCVAYDGIHDFVTGYCAPGPNAFVQCESNVPHSFSGGLESWSSGVLFDIVNVDGNALYLGNRGQDGNGAGWTAANSVTWNCSAARIDCYKPPTAQNWSFGSWSQFSGDGYWGESNNTIQPRSLYYAQLAERLQNNVNALAHIMPVSSEASSSPSVETAGILTKEAYQPRASLRDWIIAAASRNPIDIQSKGVAVLQEKQVPVVRPKAAASALVNQSGWLVRAGSVLQGRRNDIPWWSGGIHGKDLANAKPAITRFVPGRTGRGYTDDLDELTDSMLANNAIGMEQHYALWYERRRDDHQRVRRMDGDAWAPFYELPFARSGKETAWDGLSKYDLTRYNTWYWNRMKQFADLADQKGLLLVHQNYFQHNIIEAGAHYADFPWRTANNINNVGFPEPVNYAGDKRIFMAEQFYDTSVVVRNKLHKQYIWQCLDNFKNNSGVIQLIGEEFTGPLHFVQFWADAIATWEQKHKRSQLIGLGTTKDVQDAILQDKRRSAVIDIIDIRYWHYQMDGTVYAPAGGQNLAPRQHARLLKPKRSSFEQVYRAVKEYRLKYPGKAVMYSADGAAQFGWAVFMGGGSLPELPATTDKALLKAAATMQPLAGDGMIALANDNEMIIYAGGKNLSVDLSAWKGNFRLQYVDLRSGKVTGDDKVITAGAVVSLDIPANAGLIWLIRYVE